MKRILTALLSVTLAVAVVFAAGRTNRVVDDAAGLNLEFSEMRHDFGTVSDSEGSVGHEFTVTNAGSEPVAILSATASCGCTRPDYSKKPLAPGESSRIKVKFIPAGQKGEFSKDVKVRFKCANGKSKRVTLKITGVVVPGK